MDRYRCIESFEVVICDDDGRTDENDRRIAIEEGTEWNDKGKAYVIGLVDGIHLETDEYRWLEVSKEMLERYFEKVGFSKGGDAMQVGGDYPLQ